MSTRILMNRDYNRSRSASYIKVLFGAVIALILLVVLVPLMLNHKPRGGIKRPSADRNLLVAEVPRTAIPAVPQSAPSVPAPRESLPGEDRTAGAVPDMMPPAPEQAAQPVPLERPAVVRFTGENAPKGDTAARGTNPNEHAATPSPAPDKSAAAPAASAATAAPDAAKPKAGAAPQQTAKPVVLASVQPVAKPKEIPAGTPTVKEEKIQKAAKPTQAKEVQRYIIQVGSFQSRQNAEALLESLKKKGYSAVMKPHTHETLGQMYLVQMGPIDSLDKANTLKTCIERDEKAKPMLLKVEQER